MRRPTHLALTVACCLLVAACGDEVDPGVAEVTSDEAADLRVTGTDELLWRPDDLTVAAGPVDVRVSCGNRTGHEFAIEGVRGGEPIAACDAGGTGVGTVELEAGQYAFFCAVPGHRDEGMVGDLTVQ